MKRILPITSAALIWLLYLCGAASADNGARGIDSGAVAWLLSSTAMVIVMTLPGLALFYGGLSRRHHVLSTIMYSFTSLAVVGVVWVLWGYSLAFGQDMAGIMGNFAHFGLHGIPLPGSGGPQNLNMNLAIPDSLFVAFQGAFAVITVALISGAYAERFRFSAFLLFSVLWVTFIYAPLAHWVWGGGWLARIGSLDFAGGTVVHISAGASGLAAAMFLGKRKGYGKEKMKPHNVPMVVTGAGLLWFGWFGFNAGSAMAADGLAASAFLVTNASAAAAAIGWLAAEWIHGKSPTAVGIASGAVAGLVAITPAAGYVTPMAGLIIGLVGGILCYFAVYYKHRMGYDDAFDAFGIHGIGGIWGSLATGIFASSLITGPNGPTGLLEGNPAQLLIQVAAVLATFIFCFVGSAAILKMTDILTPLRPDADAELMGLDQTEHKESAYN